MLVTNLLYAVFFYLLQALLKLFSIVLIALFANYWILIPALVVIILLMLFRHYFLCTSRNIQRLEALGKATVLQCVCSHV